MPARTERLARKKISSANLLTLAFLNMRRHGLRAIVNVVGIAVAVASLTFFLAFWRGTYEGIMFSSAIDYATSHGQFMRPSFDDDDPDSWLNRANLFDETVARGPALERAIAGEPSRADGNTRADDGLRLAPTLMSPAFAGDGSRKAPVILMGVDFAIERETLSIANRMKDGTFSDSGGVVIGAKLAKTLGLSVGDEIRIQASTVDSAPNLDYWKISGIYSTGYPPMDRDAVLMGLPEAQGLLAAEGMINKVYARLVPGPSSIERERAIARVKARSTELKTLRLEFREWRQYAKFIVDDARKDGGFFAIFIAILLFLSLATMAGTMRVTVWERKREIGMLRASGWFQSEIARQFLIEALLIGIAGSAAGCLLGAVAAEALAAHPIRFIGNMADLDIPNFMLTADLEPVDAIPAFASGLIISLFAGIMPALSGARMPILAALSER